MLPEFHWKFFIKYSNSDKVEISSSPACALLPKFSPWQSCFPYISGSLQLSYKAFWSTPQILITLWLLYFITHTTWQVKQSSRQNLRAECPTTAAYKGEGYVFPKQWQMSKQQEIRNLDWISLELYHVLATFLKIGKDWLASGVLNMRTEFKYPGCCYSLPLDTSFGNFPAEIKLEVISILPDIAKFLFNLLTEVQDKKNHPIGPLPFFSM